MPRLPTIRVIGSQAMSTRFPVGVVPVVRGSVAVIVCCPSPGPLRAGHELGRRPAPLGLLVGGAGRHLPQPSDGRAVDAGCGGRGLRARRFVHEGHELVGEAGHGAADADPADVRAPAHAVDPAPLGHVALHHRAPAAQLDDALGRAVLRREVALLVVAGTVAPLVHGAAEQPGGPQGVVERDHRRLAGRQVEQVGQGLGEVVGLDRAARHADDRDAGLGLPVPAEVVGHAHRAGGVAGHGVDPAVRGAGPGGHDGRRLGRQPVEPLAGGDRLPGGGVVAEAGPVPLVLDLLVGDGPLDDQDERLQVTAVGLEEPLEEVVRATVRAALEVDQRPVHGHFRQSRQRAERDLLDAGLSGRGEGHGVTVAAEPGVDPEHMDQDVLSGLSGLSGGCGRHVATLPGVCAQPTPGFRTPVFRWDRISVHLRGLGCDYAHVPASVKNAPSRQSATGPQVRSQSRHATIPSPVVTDRGRTRTWGFSERQCPANVSSRTSTYGSRSILLITTRSATENIYGYLSGLSSPSVTDATTTLAASPRSNSAGQTRLPPFSTKTRDPRAGRSSSSARASMSASRWQPAPVLIWTTGAPALRIRSASRRVSCSPSTTAIGRLDASSVIVRCSRDVLPEPGELMRLRATMPCSASQARLWSARWSFFASRAVSISTSPGSGSWTCSCTWGWACGWSWPVGCP